MKIETTWDNLNKVPWTAINRAGDYYHTHVRSTKGAFIDRLKAGAEYSAWMRNNWGIHHEPLEFKIVDEKKYTMFLLRWA